MANGQKAGIRMRTFTDEDFVVGCPNTQDQQSQSNMLLVERPADMDDDYDDDYYNFDSDLHIGYELEIYMLSNRLDDSPDEGLFDHVELLYREHIGYLRKEYKLSDHLSTYRFRRPKNDWEQREAERDVYRARSTILTEELLDIEKQCKKAERHNRLLMSSEERVAVLTRLTKEMNGLLAEGQRVIETQEKFPDLTEELEKIEQLQSRWRSVVKISKRQLRRAKSEVFREQVAEDVLEVNDPTENPRFWCAKNVQLKKI